MLLRNRNLNTQQEPKNVAVSTVKRSIEQISKNNRCDHPLLNEEPKSKKEATFFAPRNKTDNVSEATKQRVDVSNGSRALADEQILNPFEQCRIMRGHIKSNSR